MVDNRVAAFRQQGTEDLCVGYMMNAFFVEAGLHAIKEWDSCIP